MSPSTHGHLFFKMQRLKFITQDFQKHQCIWQQILEQLVASEPNIYLITINEAKTYFWVHCGNGSTMFGSKNTVSINGSDFEPQVGRLYGPFKDDFIVLKSIKYNSLIWPCQSVSSIFSANRSSPGEADTASFPHTTEFGKWCKPFFIFRKSHQKQD